MNESQKAMDDLIYKVNKLSERRNVVSSDMREAIKQVLQHHNGVLSDYWLDDESALAEIVRIVSGEGKP